MFGKIRRISPKTRWFIFNWAIYFLLMLVTTIYAYGRLDFVRTKNISENVKTT